MDAQINAEYTEEEAAFVKNNFEMKTIMAEKRKQIMQEFTGKKDPNKSAQDDKMRQQQEEYAQRGISLTYFSKDDERYFASELGLLYWSAFLSVLGCVLGPISLTWMKTCSVPNASCTSWTNR